MKNSISLILLALFVISCTGRKANYRLYKTQPIVDYNQSYEYYDTNIKVNDGIVRYNEQTVILFHSKIINEKELKNLIKKGKIKSIQSVTDEINIAKLGYNYDKVKRIIVAKRK